MKEKMEADYQDWLFDLASEWFFARYGRKPYNRLILHLYSKPFICPFYNDKNRASDGIELRMNFIDTNQYGYTYRDVYLYLNKPCSMLEMMIALAKRCEDHIMGDPDIGDRSYIWFTNMIETMGLDSMDDMNYDDNYVDQVIFNVLNRKYEKNGSGGLFRINDPEKDMRQVEIWYQMNWYLDELIF